MSLYTELKRRNVIRVAVAYLVGAWLLIEVAGAVFPSLGIPESGVRWLMIICALGFLPAVWIAWAYELTPDGLMRDAPLARSSAKPLDIYIIFLVIGAVAIVVADFLWRVDQPLEQESVTVESVEPLAKAAPQHPHNSIAVLPFVNMSDDEANEYFSEGVSEAVLNLLARVPELRVISRSSAFYFKDKNFDIPTVAEQLNVSHVLEGSVRKAGDQVRITVQLIDTGTDTHLWSDTYDRTLDDIFAIQDEIALAVVEQLRVELLGEVPASEEAEAEAYTFYLQARHISALFTAEAFEQSIALYKQALGVDPGYAAAWSGLAGSYIIQATTGQRSADEVIDLAREAAEQALAVNPEYAPALAYLSIISLRFDRDLQMAAKHLQRALMLEPFNPDILRQAATMYRSLDRLEEAITVDEYVVDRDPVNPIGHYFLGFSYLVAQRLDEAITSFDNALMLSPRHVSAHYRIGTALYYKGELQAALAEMEKEPRPTKHLMGEAMIYFALGQEDAAAAALNELTDEYHYTTAYNIAYLLALRGDADAAFAWLDKAAQYRDSGLIQIVFQPEFESIHEDPRWLPFLESIGMSPAQLAAIEFEVSLPD